MRFEPKTEEQIETEGLLAEGDYDFGVMTAEDKKSKKGSDMIALKLCVFSRDGDRHVYDYLVPQMAFKLRHFCESTGLLAKYDRGEVAAEDCLRKNGICRIEIEPAKNGYPAKNTVADYVVKQRDIQRPEPAKPMAPVPVPAPASQPARTPDDDVPF